VFAIKKVALGGSDEKLVTVKKLSSGEMIKHSLGTHWYWDQSLPKGKETSTRVPKTQ
jgi:hypothetical protein